MSMSAIWGEHYLSRIGAVFEDRNQARAAVGRLTSQTGIAPDQIRVLEPGDPSWAHKLEPESRGIGGTLIRSHITLGAAGLVLGIAIALALILLGIDLFVLSWGYTLLVFGFFGAIAGLLLAGLVSLRPDHDRLVAVARTSARDDCWYVVVHARNRSEGRRARDVLSRISDDVVTTL
jgi:hypothetical protein